MEQRELSGVLFKNDKKSEGKHPDYKGKAKIGGVEYWLASWIKDGANGKFMSLAFTAKDAPAEPESTPEDDDDIPF